MKKFKTTDEIGVPKKLIDQVIGQDKAVETIKKAAKQKRNVLLIGSPGTGKSMLAQAMAELMPTEELEDVLVYKNQNNENNPKVKTVKTYPDYNNLKKNPLLIKYYNKKELTAIKHFSLKDEKKKLPDILKVGLGRRIVTKKEEKEEEKKGPSIMMVLLIVGVILLGVIFLADVEENVKWLIVAALLGLTLLYILSGATAGITRRLSPFESTKPKLIIDNSRKKNAPFEDATGMKAGALLGDVKHDPLQSFFSHTIVYRKTNERAGPAVLKDLVDELMEKYPNRIERNEDNYEGIVLPKEEEIYVLGYKDGKIKPVRVFCVNRRTYDGKMCVINDKENRLIVTPEHNIYINGKYIEAEKLNSIKNSISNFKNSNTTLQKIIRGVEQTPFNESTIEYSGTVYNITTESGNLFANGILVSNSGGMGTPAHLRVESGSIHKANKGVLFIDEIASLKMNWQQELLTAMQEKRYPITGQSETSSGALVKTEHVPADFVLVASGNLPDLKQIHPALRSRIRGAGYEIYVEDEMDDNEENEEKLVQFVAQEVERDKKIPHFTKEAVERIIEEARKASGRKKKFTMNLRELGGLIRAAGDIAKEENAGYVDAIHVGKAKKVFTSIELQLGRKIIEKKKEYQIIITEGTELGRVNGLAILGDPNAGLVLPIVAEITPASSKEEGKVIATGKLGEIAKEAVVNMSAIIKKYIGKDISQKDIHIQFLQTYEGLEGDSASISVATAVISALEGIPVKQDFAMTGSLDVRGEVLPVGGVSGKIEAAIDSGIKNAIVPAMNYKDIYLPKEKKGKINIHRVKNFAEVLDYVLKDCAKKRALLKKMRKLYKD